MSASGFGRKGFNNSAAPQPQIASLAQHRVEPIDEMAIKRAAFIAAERSRRDTAVPFSAQQQERPSQYDDAALRQYSELTKAPLKQKSMFLAYILWYFGGIVSAHRFYLGATDSAFKQCGGVVGGAIVLGMGVSMHVSAISTIGAVTLIGAVMWCLLDLFFIPSLCRKANTPAI
jgi:TM2 domain